MARRRAPAPSAETLAERQAHKADGRHARPAEQSQAAATTSVARWYHVLHPRGVFGHPQGSRAQLSLTDGQESSLVSAGALTPADGPAAVVATPEPETVETGTTPADNEANEAE